jgi:hypothetical protein
MIRGTALGYRLNDRGFESRQGLGIFIFTTASGTHPASYAMGTRSYFSGGKAAGAWSWPLTSIWCRGQRMSAAIPTLPQYAFIA